MFKKTKSNLIIVSLMGSLFLLLFSSQVILAQPLDAQIPLVNQLGNSPSPYLAAHAKDPVAWQEWSPAVMTRARFENKLLFVSIGYFSCHWCHVMQAESYRNTEIAALINENFIPVKVDRELEVALDAQMIAYAQDILGSAGWPLNVFITPEGYPLYAILYEPPNNFKLKITGLAREWQKDSAGLKAIAQKSAKPDLPVKKVKPTAKLAEEYRLQLVHETLEQADMISGGINVPRKFPLSPQLAALLEVESGKHNKKLAEWLQLTLDHMMNGGLRDHLAGGFFRYTVDPSWQQPHFEKMLYDNAQLAMIYLRAAKVFNRPDYRIVAIETLDFMLSEMMLDQGMITSISAVNDAGIEGASYLWSKDELKLILNQNDFELLVKIWGMDKPSDFDTGYLPYNKIVPAVEEQLRLDDLYPRLLKIRQSRVSPKDTKLLAGLNGLALAAFSEAGAIAPRFEHAAKQLRTFIVESLWKNETLHKGLSNQHLLDLADLEGYSYAAFGLMRYATLRKSEADIQVAQKMAKVAWEDFYLPCGFLLEKNNELAKPFCQAGVEDGPLPSSSSMLIKTSLELGNKLLYSKAENALHLASKLRSQGVFWQASQVSALSRLFNPLSLKRQK